uniref:ATP synthase F0 subunit 8 n=1 Tax=Cyanophora paradoxa TaxID=2762 RepID=A0A097PBP9_CYAPA|nr:ATP synthase F0 subunit 8 [Cyanophora paradoxa]
MPQLDFTTYLSQLTWFFICFVGFYLVNVQYVIPYFSLSKKTRKLCTFLLFFEKYIINSILILNKKSNLKLNSESFTLNKNMFNNII